jgi:hypothetical protein
MAHRGVLVAVLGVMMLGLLNLAQGSHVGQVTECVPCLECVQTCQAPSKCNGCGSPYEISVNCTCDGPLPDGHRAAPHVAKAVKKQRLTEKHHAAPAAAPRVDVTQSCTSCDDCLKYCPWKDGSMTCTNCAKSGECWCMSTQPSSQPIMEAGNGGEEPVVAFQP